MGAKHGASSSTFSSTLRVARAALLHRTMANVVSAHSWMEFHPPKREERGIPRSCILPVLNMYIRPSRDKKAETTILDCSLDAKSILTPKNAFRTTHPKICGALGKPLSSLSGRPMLGGSLRLCKSASTASVGASSYLWGRTFPAMKAVIQMPNTSWRTCPFAP